MAFAHISVLSILTIVHAGCRQGCRYEGSLESGKMEIVWYRLFSSQWMSSKENSLHIAYSGGIFAQPSGCPLLEMGHI